MSTVISISTCRRYGVARVCRVWSVARGLESIGGADQPSCRWLRDGDRGRRARCRTRLWSKRSDEC